MLLSVLLEWVKNTEQCSLHCVVVIFSRLNITVNVTALKMVTMHLL